MRIKCQRLNADSKEYEEVEVEVPQPVYDTLKYYNEADQRMKSGGSRMNPEDFQRHGGPGGGAGNAGKKSLTSKIRNLFATSATKT